MDLSIFASPEAWISLVSLIFLEIVLGVDNLVFISITTNRLPEDKQHIGRKLGLAGALVMRIIFLCFASFLVHMTTPLFTIDLGPYAHGFSVRDLVLLVGGGYLIYKGIAELRKHVDSLVVIPNERLKLVSEQRITLANAFSVADDVLRQGVQSISDLIQIPGVVNLDFEDVKSIMQDAGYAHMGVGRAAGKDKAEQAAIAAISSPLLETAIAGARGVIINIKSSPDIALDEIDTASQLITERASEDANIIWGAAFDDSMEDEMMVTVIATGFDGMNGENNAKAAAPAISDAELFGTPTASTAGDRAASSVVDDDDTFSDIMSIFNRK